MLCFDKHEMWVSHYLSCLAQFISILHDVDEQEVEQLHVGRAPENWNHGYYDHCTEVLRLKSHSY